MPSTDRPRAAAEIERRKAEHLELAAGSGVEAPAVAGWGDVHLVHEALPRVDASDVDLSVDLLGHRLRLPLVVAGMTGGHERAREINRLLARAAERSGIAIGLGSQRAALRDPALAPTYAVVRQEAPSAFVIANLGVSQLIRQDDEPALDRKSVV